MLDVVFDHRVYLLDANASEADRRIGRAEDRKSGGTTVRSAVLWRRVTGEFLSHRQPLFDIYDSIEVLNLASNADFDIL